MSCAARAGQRRPQVSRRTVYRDIAVLMAEGVPIRGEAGIGYALAVGYDLPPLMFDATEIEAVVLGMRLVRRDGDEALGSAADNVLGKVMAALPARRRRDLERSLDTLWVREAADEGSRGPIDSEPLRLAIREQRKVHIAYVDLSGEASRRTTWPLALAMIGRRRRVVIAWCELRRDFRSFRLDRIETLRLLDDRYDGDTARCCDAIWKPAAPGSPVRPYWRRASATNA